MQTISPDKVRYIKLGRDCKWEESCIAENTIRLGYDQSPNEPSLHQESLKGEWDVVREYWLNVRNGDAGTATRDVNQIRSFYELGEEDIWITFYKRKLYWCKASSEVIELEDRSRIRKVIGAWSSTDKYGRDLRIENLDGRLAMKQSFQGTICTVEDDIKDYLIHKINGETIPAVKRSKEILKSLESTITELIQGLGWKDFEILVDLIFARSGWQRFSVLGKTQKDIDLEVYLPTNQKTAFVQIKSTTTVSEIQKYIDIYKSYEQYDEMYFIFHSGTISPDRFKDLDKVHIWGVGRVANLVVNLGLVEWLINKRS